jgi:hypothetical protein
MKLFSYNIILKLIKYKIFLNFLINDFIYFNFRKLYIWKEI